MVLVHFVWLYVLSGNGNLAHYIWSNYSRDLTRPKTPPNGGELEGKSPKISGKSRLVKYNNLARLYYSSKIMVI